MLVEATRSLTWNLDSCVLRGKPVSNSSPSRQSSAVLFCRDLQTGKCTHSKDHYGMIRNEKKWLQHICAKCWTSSRTIARHTEFSEDCPGISASHLRVPLESSPSTSASLSSGTVFSNDNSFLDFHDSRLFKTFSPMVYSSLCSSVDSCHASYSCSGQVLGSHGFDATRESQCLLSDSRLSVLDSRPSATISPVVAFGLSSSYFLNLHARIFASRAYNFAGLRLPVPSSLCVPV